MGPPNMFFLWSSLWFLWGPPNRVLSMVLLLYGPPRGSLDGFFLSFSMVFGGSFYGLSLWLLWGPPNGSSLWFLWDPPYDSSLCSSLWFLWGPAYGSSSGVLLMDPLCRFCGILTFALYAPLYGFCRILLTIPLYALLYGFCRILLIIPFYVPLYGFCGVLPVGPPVGSSPWVLPGIFSMILSAPSLWFLPGVSTVPLSPAHPL